MVSLGAAYLTVHVDDMMLASLSSAFNLGSKNPFKSGMKLLAIILISVACLPASGMSVVKSQDGIRIHRVGFVDMMTAKYQVNIAVKV